MNLGKLKIALVNVPPLGVIEPWYDAPDFPRGALACLAAYLREQTAYEILCIDAKFDRLSFQQTIDSIIAFQPTIVGFTAFTNEIKPCAYVAAKVKALQPSIVTLIGGAHFTALPDRTLMEFPAFDCGISGDGEETLLAFCRAIENKTSLLGIEGVVFRQEGEIVMNKPRARMLDMDALPMPAWDLFRPAKHYWVQSSKGCPFKCHFCMNHNGRVARKNSVQKTMDELNFIITNFKPEWIRFGDELFTVDMNRTAALLDEMAKQDIGGKVKWDVQTHVKYVNRELFKKFKAAKVTQVDMGVESGDNEILKHMGKATNLDMIRDAFKVAHEEGVTTGSLLLIGQPFETRHTMMKTIDLAVEINSSIPMFGIMTPFPGTEIARMAAKGEGGFKNLSTNWDEYRKQIGGAVEFAGVSRNEIEWLQFWGYLKVFIWNFRFFELAKFIWKYQVEGFNVIKKLLLRTNNITDLFNNMPKDYEETIYSKYKASYADMIYSKEQFDVIQRDEIRRTNLLRPELIKEQNPVKELKLF